jgi:hypothetical protein
MQNPGSDAGVFCEAAVAQMKRSAIRGLLSALAKIAIVYTVVSTPIAWQYPGADISMQ